MRFRSKTHELLLTRPGYSWWMSAMEAKGLTHGEAAELWLEQEELGRQWEAERESHADRR